MKKFVSIFLVLCFIFSAVAMTACGDKDGSKDTTPETTPEVTDAATDPVETVPTDGEPEEDMYPYDGEVIPASIDYWGWGAPDATSVYFAIDEAHVIHDGNGTWNNSLDTIAAKVFDLDTETCYDCDEKKEYANVEGELTGIFPDPTADVAYVGAWIEEGVVLSQIRWFPRTANLTRTAGGSFQASVDGTEWVTLHYIAENPIGGDMEFIPIDDDTVYYYVRFLGRSAESEEYALYNNETSFGNIAEIEIWGTPGK